MTAIAPGHHLYRADDGGWRCSAPDDRFVRVTGDSEVLAAFQRVVHGGARPAEFTLAGEQRTGFDQLDRLFREKGLLEPDRLATAGRVRTARIHVDGDNPVAAAVVDLLDGTGPVVRDPVDESTVGAADVLISCDGWLPDARWQQLDGWCAAAGTAWHRVHAEGTRFYLGPLTVPGQTATYGDLRGRRLAASGVADELLAHWTYLDDPGQAPPPVPWPDRAGLAVLAGLLVADVRHYLDTGRPAWPNTQLGVDLASGRITHHPVLPLPATARS